jgi:tetratricopeptide (TPR) repeat protein
VPNQASHHTLEVLVGSGSAGARDAAARQRVARVADTIPGLRVVDSEDARYWTFQRFLGESLPASGPLLIRAHQLHKAFPPGQTGSTRLVLTQPAYQLQRWLDWMDLRGNVSLIADADAAALRRVAPEAWQNRGPWSRIALVTLPEPNEPNEPNERNEREPPEPFEPFELLRAFITEDSDERLALCRRAVEARTDDPVAHLALGSAYMEVQDLDASQTAIERAVALAPDWEAAHYELAKLFLRRDDMERASTSFAEAGRLMPSFSAAFSNLGATLGELDRPKEALRAFEQALKYDPNGYTILNNIGVVSRELGSLHESEAAFRKVVALAPEFVFGHYNLGHTLFLQGRYQAALSAYTEGQRRDPEKNARQACRLAVVRLAAGDPDGALRDLQRSTASLTGDQKREILGEAQEILWALLTDQPALPGWRTVADAVKSQLEALT